jgi:hypothetical protein
MTPRIDPTTIPTIFPMSLALAADNILASVGDGCGLLGSVGDDVGDIVVLDDIESLVVMNDEKASSDAEVSAVREDKVGGRLILDGVDVGAGVDDDLLEMVFAAELVVGAVQVLSVVGVLGGLGVVAVIVTKIVEVGTSLSDGGGAKA